VSFDRIAQVSPRNPSANHPQVLTLKLAAEYLRISKAHLSNIIAGRVPGVPHLRHVRVGRRILIKREWAEEWLETAAEGPQQQW
jgi:excisionase family DNA binding protein